MNDLERSLFFAKKEIEQLEKQIPPKDLSKYIQIKTEAYCKQRSIGNYQLPTLNNVLGAYLEIIKYLKGL